MLLGSRADCTAKCRSPGHCQELARALSHPVEELASLAWLVRHCHAPARARDRQGRTLVHAAAARGLLVVLEWLLRQKDAPLNGKDLESGYSPLHRAAFHGQLRALVFLLGRGANLALADSDGLTVLDHLVLDRPLHVTYEKRAPLEAYLWGANSNYNLGLGTNTTRALPDVLDQFRRAGTHLASVCLGKFHSGFVTRSGTALTCGHGRGGRLGHGSETMQLLPGAVQLPGPCTGLALGTDHTVFLCEGGAVYTAGMNTYHQLGHTPPPPLLLAPAPCTPRGVKAVGVAAARFHSLYWTAEDVYTWGLNAGQLGHIKGEKTVVQPKLVASLMGREGGIARVVSSDGAVVVLTARGDVLALHEYGTKKLGQRQHGVQQLQVTGGQLDPQVDPGGRLDNIDFKLVAGGGSRLTVFLLSAHGKISVWEEQRENSFIPCLFSLSREVIVADVALHRGGLLIVSRDGEAWTGSHQQGKAPRANSKAGLTDLIKLKRLPHIHRAVSAVCDSKGRNFCVLQVAPNEALTLVPEISASLMEQHLAELLRDVQQFDSLHDAICQVGDRRFPAHSFVLASGSESLSKQLRFAELQEEQEQVVVQVEDVHPDIFRLVLQFLYTKSCDLFYAGAPAASLATLELVTEEQQDILEVRGDPAKVSAFQVYSENKNRKKKSSRAKAESEAALRKARSRCPLALLQEAAKTLGIFGLQKVADCFRVVEGLVVTKVASPATRIEFTYKHLPELHDITIECDDSKAVFAHKCILVARSEYFCGMFNSAWSESSAVLKMPLPANIMEAVVDFLYKDDCLAVIKSEDLEFVSNVLVAADQFLLARLKEICECQLTKMLTLKNAAEILQFSFHYLAAQLQDSAMQFICLNLPALLETKVLEQLEDEVFAHLDRFYQSSNPVFGRRTVRSAAGFPSQEEVEAEWRVEPVSLEVLEQAAESVGAAGGRAGRQRRHSGGEKGRRSPRVRTTSGESLGSAEEMEEEAGEEELEGFDKLSLGDFDIEERDEEEVSGASPPPASPDKSYFSSVLGDPLLPAKGSKPVEAATVRQEKKGRLSQKDRKRLTTLESEVPGRRQEVPASPSTPKAEWLGWGAAPETPVSNSPSLSEIMKMENWPSEGKKTSPPPVADKKKTSWKKISLGEEVVPEKKAPSPGKSCSNPWNIVSPPPNNNSVNLGLTDKTARDHQTSGRSETFEQIMEESARQEQTLHKVQSKPLAVTQIEERAIEELRLFYQADMATDEVITVTRVQSQLAAPPVWRRIKK